MRAARKQWRIAPPLAHARSIERRVSVGAATRLHHHMPCCGPNHGCRPATKHPCLLGPMRAHAAKNVPRKPRHEPFGKTLRGDMGHASVAKLLDPKRSALSMKVSNFRRQSAKEVSGGWGNSKTKKAKSAKRSRAGRQLPRRRRVPANVYSQCVGVVATNALFNPPEMRKKVQTIAFETNVLPREVKNCDKCVDCGVGRRLHGFWAG